MVSRNVVSELKVFAKIVLL